MVRPAAMLFVWAQAGEALPVLLAMWGGAMSRFARAVDENQAQVVSALRAAGATVKDLRQVGAGTPDLLVGYRRQTYLLEVKDGSKSPCRQALTDDEEIWHRTWRGLPVAIVRTVTEALKAIGAT